MTNKKSLTLFMRGLLAATVLFAPYAPSVAQERSATSTDFSAQQQQENKGQQKSCAGRAPGSATSSSPASSSTASGSAAQRHRNGHSAEGHFART